MNFSESLKGLDDQELWKKHVISMFVVWPLILVVLSLVLLVVTHFVRISFERPEVILIIVIGAILVEDLCFINFKAWRSRREAERR